MAMYEVTYTYPSMHNVPITKTVVVDREKAVEICERIESLEGYRLNDVTRVE